LRSIPKSLEELRDGEILILKNVRTFPDERKKSTAEEHSKSEFIQGLYPLADLFVSDAFAAAHRAHASIIGFTPLLLSVAGRIMERELKALGRVLENPEKPCVFIFGGAKADDSLMISRYVLTNNVADYILPGGVIGHLFLAAKGIDLGKPNMDFLEKQEAMLLIPGIQELMKTYPDKIKVPVDLAAEVDTKRKEVAVNDLPIENPIFDIGEKTSEEYAKIIGKAKTIVLSGPVGVFENKEFMLGTKNVFNAVADSEGFSLVGGGHTIAATKKLDLADKISYISTAGGALIEFLMGEALPGVVALEQAATKS
jgi:phosphoglycerate kinase